MNIKPSKDQMREWHDAAVMSATPGSLAFTWTVAELAAQWGAAQAQQTTVDAARVLEWMRTPDRKPANLAFTDGPERQAAYWIEIAQQTTEEPELREKPKPDVVTECRILGVYKSILWNSETNTVDRANLRLTFTADGVLKNAKVI